MAAHKLYTFNEPGNCYKVRLLASLLGIDLEEIEIDYYNKEQRTPEFQAINPRCQIPALVLGDRTLTDSAAILVYLAGTCPDRGAARGPSSYWPSDVLKQATITDWMAFDASWISNGLCKARGILSFHRTQAGIGTDLMEKELAAAQQRGVESLNILNKHLEKHRWLADAGESAECPTIADICVFPYVALAPMAGISLGPFAAVQGWIRTIRELEGFIPMKGLDDPMYKHRK